MLTKKNSEFSVCKVVEICAVLPPAGIHYTENNDLSRFIRLAPLNRGQERPQAKKLHFLGHVLFYFIINSFIV